MTKIIYSVTIIGDGARATHSTEELDYPETPAGKLDSDAMALVQQFGASHSAMMTAMRQLERTAPASNRHERRKPARKADVGKLVTAGAR